MVPSSETASIEIFDWPSGQLSGGVAKEVPRVVPKPDEGKPLPGVALLAVDDGKMNWGDVAIGVSVPMPPFTLYVPFAGPNTAT